jgi:3-oxoadipate enol-lactonase
MRSAQVSVIRERTIETPRGRMAWLEAGSGWPLFLLHGFPLNADMWRPQLDRVPIGWRFLAPDLRGFGQTDPGAAALTMDEWGADVFSLMDCLEIDDAVIGGLSMGGYVTFAMYRQAPSRFNGMVLANTRSLPDSEQARAGRMQLRTMLAEQGPSIVAAQLLPKLFSSAADRGAVDFAHDLIDAAAPESVDAAIGALMDRPDSTHDLARITCAALVIASDEDAIVPLAEAEAMQRALTRSRLTVIGGAGHMSNLEQPDAFSRALEDFLRSAL